jgi:hypothetical protein
MKCSMDGGEEWVSVSAHDTTRASLAIFWTRSPLPHMISRVPRFLSLGHLGWQVNAYSLADSAISPDPKMICTYNREVHRQFTQPPAGDFESRKFGR